MICYQSSNRMQHWPFFHGPQLLCVIVYYYSWSLTVIEWFSHQNTCVAHVCSLYPSAPLTSSRYRSHEIVSVEQRPDTTHYIRRTVMLRSSYIGIHGFECITVHVRRISRHYVLFEQLRAAHTLEVAGVQEVNSAQFCLPMLLIWCAPPLDTGRSMELFYSSRADTFSRPKPSATMLVFPPSGCIHAIPTPIWAPYVPPFTVYFESMWDTCETHAAIYSRCRLQCALGCLSCSTMHYGVSPPTQSAESFPIEPNKGTHNYSIVVHIQRFSS